MKKLMIAAAVICAAALSQAAVVNWGTDKAVTFGGTKLAGKEVQLWIVGVGDSADLQVDLRSTMSGAPANQGKLASGAGTMQNAYDYNSTIAGGKVFNGADLGREYYIVIKHTDGGVDYTYTSSAVASSGLSETSLGSLSFAFSDTKSTVAGTKDAWVSAVPEPTSGLLLLLGVAGLALRRRRA